MDTSTTKTNKIISSQISGSLHEACLLACLLAQVVCRQVPVIPSSKRGLGQKSTASWSLNYMSKKKDKSHNKGLISADRSNKGYSTAYNTPFTQSRLQWIYTFRYLKLLFGGKEARPLGPCNPEPPGYVSQTHSRLIRNQLNTGKLNIVASSMDSDLEAFSHNPTDGSFAPLACQPRAMTNYPNQLFLSY